MFQIPTSVVVRCPTTTCNRSKGLKYVIFAALLGVFIWQAQQDIQYTSLSEGWNASWIDFSSLIQTPQQEVESELPSLFSSSSSAVDGSDWFDIDTWESETRGAGCYHIEDVCHSSNQMFYNLPPHHPVPTNSSHQPYPLSLQLNWKGIHSWYPQTVNVQPHRPDSDFVCRYNPIPNHFVLYSYYNDMLGEFYVRLFRGFWEAVHDYKAAIQKKRDGQLQGKSHDNSTIISTIDNNYDNDNPNPQEGHPDNEDGYLNHFVTQTQLYMHLYQGRKVLDSQHLYLGTLSNQPVLPLTTIFDTPGCVCFRRLFFCGYDVATDPAPSTNDGDSTGDGAESMMVSIKPSTLIQRTHGRVGEVGFQQPMREDLLNKFIRGNSIIREQVEQRRIQNIQKEIGRRKHRHKKIERDQKEWRVIGLAQRNGRRRWEGLEDLIRKCNNGFVSKGIVCIAVNIEEEPNAMGHVLAHAGLDALMGIHGAQLTHALLMPKGSLVVEFLPWFPYHLKPKVWGQWTASSDHPTPLGVIYSDTDLNHIGYPLPRASSVDTCHGENYKADCFTQPELRWDNRDFQVEWEVVRDIINKFIVMNPKTCQDFNDNAGDDYVLYNVQCIPDNSTEMEIGHFYRPTAWVHEKALWTEEQEMNATNTTAAG